MAELRFNNSNNSLGRVRIVKKKKKSFRGLEKKGVRWVESWIGRPRGVSSIRESEQRIKRLEGEGGGRGAWYAREIARRGNVVTARSGAA